MQWTSKDPPIYVWKGDTWLNERDGKIYHSDVDNGCWYNSEDKPFSNHSVIIVFPKKVRVFK